MLIKDYLKFVISIFICQTTGIIGAFFTASSVDSWYSVLNKPSFTPLGWVFTFVWILLYLLMGISLYVVWMKKNKTAMILFFIQLALNLLWTIIFFGLRQPLLALIEIIALWIFILITKIKFYKISRTAAYLLMPYLLWVSFAVVLNLLIVLMN